MTDDELRRTQTFRALRDCLVRHLRAKRETALDRLEQTGQRWDPDLSRELDAVDEALVRVGAQDQK